MSLCRYRLFTPHSTLAESITGFIVLLFEFVTRSKSIKSGLLCLRVPLNRMFLQDDCGDALLRAALYWMREVLVRMTRHFDFRPCPYAVEFVCPFLWGKLATLQVKDEPF